MSGLKRWMLSVVIILVACRPVDEAHPPLPSPQINIETAAPSPITPTFPPSENEAVSNITVYVQEIFAHGQTLGNRPNVISKVGDSITVSKSYLHPFGVGNYDLYQYAHLETVVERFRGGYARTDNAFANKSLAAGVGWTSFHLLSTDYTDLSACLPTETPLLCEYRIVKPSIAIIMLGTNDVGILNASDYAANLEKIVQISIERGIIPILSTMPPRQNYDQLVGQFNSLMRQIAQHHRIPLLNYHGAMEQLPQRGLGNDGVHPSSPPGNFSQSAHFTPQNLQYGYTIRNLTTLQALDALLKWLD